jgi:hypothetical protein
MAEAVPPQGLFKPDPGIAPLPPSDAMSIPGINQAATDEELEDTSDLGKHPATENKTQTVTMDSVRLNDAAKPHAQSVPQSGHVTAAPGMIQRTSVKSYIVLIVIAFMMFVFLGILAFTFGSKYFQNRSGAITPTATIEAISQSVMEAKPIGDIVDEEEAQPTEEAAASQPTEASEAPMESSVTATPTAGICLTQVQNGDSLGIIFRDRYGLDYDAANEYQYRVCTGEGEAFTCDTAQPIANNNLIQAGWFIEMNDADPAACTENNGVWLSKTES